MICYITIPDDFPKAFSGTKAEDYARSLEEVIVYTDKAKSEEEPIERIKDSQVVVNTSAYTYFTRRVLASCPNLRLISIWGTGTDNVDLESAAKLGITITNTPGANALSVAEHTIAILFSLARQILFLDREIHSGSWPRV
jgi:phosphoglycerate dehydrogenase-like enzyme